MSSILRQNLVSPPAASILFDAIIQGGDLASHPLVSRPELKHPVTEVHLSYPNSPAEDE